MKLWKSKKSSSCVPGKFALANNKSDDKKQQQQAATSTLSTPTIISGDRAMSPAQSEDSGLAADRASTYASISLPREGNTSSMGIVFAERTDLSYPPVIASINSLGPASDFLAAGDRIHQIDGISTIGLTNNHVMNILLQNDGPAVVEIEYCLPEYISQNSLCVTSKLAQITVERENGYFGLTLRGGGESPLVVTNVRLHGPAFKTGRIKPGDRVLRVDNVSLINKTLLEAQQILKTGTTAEFTNLTIEYDVSVMQGVEFSIGPLLIEIERPLNDKLGLILGNFANFPINDHGIMNNLDELTPSAIYVAGLLPASISDRCGALSIGDQILSIDETVIENTALSPEDVMAILDANTNKGYTQIQIMPAHAIAKRAGIMCGSYNTLESRKNTKQRKFARKSSLPLESGTLNTSLGLCRSESIQVVLDCSQGSGIVIGSYQSGSSSGSGSGSGGGRCGYVITQILPDSVAERSGCIQKGDRIISINKLYNLDVQIIRQILGDINTVRNPSHSPQAINSSTSYPGTHWVELEIEFDMADSVIPASGVFNVKLIKFNANGLGLTVNATNHGTYVITEVKPGSAAHRTGSLRAGDILLAVDAHTLQHFNVDSLLKENKNEFTTLTIKRTSLPDFLFDAQQRCNTIYANSLPANEECLYGNSGGNGVGGYKAQFSEPRSTSESTSSKSQESQPNYFHLDLEARMLPAGQACIISSSTGTTLPLPLRSFLNTTNNTTTSTTTTSTGLSFNNERSFLTRSIGTDQSQSFTASDIADQEQFNEMAKYDVDFHQRYKSFETNAQFHLNGDGDGDAIYGTNQFVTNVRLESKGGPLGITLAGSEDLQKPIIISGLMDGGVAYNTRKLCIGDTLLAINGQNIKEMPLSHATKILQNSGNSVELKISRNISNADDVTDGVDNIPQPQVVYAKVNRRPRSPSYQNDDGGIGTSGKSDQKYRSFHVTLYKDNVYDDFGFSVSDGLYERGVFINRIRSGGPADAVGLLQPFDRIMQVNGIKTQDFDCCLTVPLIASAGDKINLIIRRINNE